MKLFRGISVTLCLLWFLGSFTTAQAQPSIISGGNTTRNSYAGPAEAVTASQQYLLLAYSDNSQGYPRLAVIRSTDGINWSSPVYPTTNINVEYMGMVTFGQDTYISFASSSGSNIGWNYITTRDGATFSAPAAWTYQGNNLPASHAAGQLNYPNLSVSPDNQTLFLNYVSGDGYVYGATSTNGVDFYNGFQVTNSWTATGGPTSIVSSDSNGYPVMQLIYLTNSNGNPVVCNSSAFAPNPVPTFSCTSGDWFRGAGNPALVSYGGTNWVFFRSHYDANNLWVAWPNGSGAFNQYMYGSQMHNSPSAAVFNNLLNISFQSGFSAEIWSYNAN